jgi:serine/threonine protein kinase
VKISDFGMSKAHLKDMAASSVGTLYYMSPERCQSNEYSFNAGDSHDTSCFRSKVIVVNQTLRYLVSWLLRLRISLWPASLCASSRRSRSLEVLPCESSIFVHTIIIMTTTVAVVIVVMALFSQRGGAGTRRVHDGAPISRQCVSSHSRLY